MFLVICIGYTDNSIELQINILIQCFTFILVPFDIHARSGLISIVKAMGANTLDVYTVKVSDLFVRSCVI